MSDLFDDPLLELIREATKGAVEQALRQRQPVRTPGTVTEYDPTAQVCSVLIDGDEAATPGIPNYTSRWTYKGERVMVEFRPPNGIGVVHLMRPTGNPSVAVQGRGLSEPLAAGVAEPLPFDTYEGGHYPDLFEIVAAPVNGVAAIQVHLRGRFKAIAHVSHSSAALGRRFIGFAVNEVPGTPGGVMDIQTGATGVFVGSVTRPINLDAEDIVQVRSLAGVAVNAVVESFSLEWIGHFPLVV